jgi:hypothetical protein
MMKLLALTALLLGSLHAQATLKPIVDVFDCTNLTQVQIFSLIVEIDVDDTRTSMIESASGARQEIETSSYKLIRQGAGGEYRLELQGSNDNIYCKYNSDRSTNE